MAEDEEACRHTELLELDFAAAEDGGGGTMMGCKTGFEEVEAGGKTVLSDIFLAVARASLSLLRSAFFGNLAVVAAVKLNFGVAASSSRATLASLYFFLQSKHVRRGFIVPFLMFSRK